MGAAAYAVFLLALGQPFIYFSAQAKQYSVDVLCTLVALALLLPARARPGASRGTRTTAGLLIPWFSPPATIVLRPMVPLPVPGRIRISPTSPNAPPA